MRILLDTNVLISGLLRKDSPVGDLMRLWVEDEFLLVTSNYQIAELRRVLEYPHLRPIIDPKHAADLLDNIDAKAVVAGDLPVVQVSPDPKDNPILATAIAGGADLIVSGDKAHMRSLGEVEDIPIMSPREAVQRLMG